VGGFYLATTFVISYGTGTLHLPRSLMLTSTLVAAAVEIGVLVAGAGWPRSSARPGSPCSAG